MALLKADIIARLQKDILPLQGFRTALYNNTITPDLGPINHAFPGNRFPLGAVHEFICTKQEELSASCGFIAGLFAALSGDNGICVWISSARDIFPPALCAFGIEPDRIIFIDLEQEKQVLWVMEEALKCNGISAVIAEMREISFKDSRRLQLAVEKSQVNGLILRCNPRTLSTTACLTRWKISSLPAITEDEMPGVGFPQWKVELQKVRNGQPGSWRVGWKAGKFIYPVEEKYSTELESKTG